MSNRTKILTPNVIKHVTLQPNQNFYKKHGLVINTVSQPRFNCTHHFTLFRSDCTWSTPWQIQDFWCIVRRCMHSLCWNYCRTFRTHSQHKNHRIYPGFRPCSVCLQHRSPGRSFFLYIVQERRNADEHTCRRHGYPEYLCSHSMLLHIL